MALKVGLDFGTSNSGVAISDGGRVTVLPIERRAILPEVVKTILYITRDNQHFIGQEAVELYYQHNVNRLRRYAKKWAGEVEYHGSDGLFYVAELIQAYLRGLKQRAEAILGEEIGGVTLGRPVKFSDSSSVDRRAEETLRMAAYEAGFREVDFELEPVAAALFYEKTLERPQNVLVFDFGGGTLDIAILRLGDVRHRKIFASGGIGIAGSDFDRAIIQKRMLSHFGLEQAAHLPELVELIQAVPDWAALPGLSTPKVRQELEQAIQRGIAPARLKTLQALIFNDLAFSFYNQVEEAKIALSSQGVTTIELKERGVDLWELLTRAQFKKDIQEYQAQIEKTLLETVATSGLEPNDIEAVVKTGGSSNIPVFSAMLGRIFGFERVKESNTFNSVVAGLAIHASTRNTF